jgi:hypothetical protein
MQTPSHESRSRYNVRFLDDIINSEGQLERIVDEVWISPQVAYDGIDGIQHIL